MERFTCSTFLFSLSLVHSVCLHQIYFHGNGYPTSNIKAITICYIAIIAIIENSGAVKETSMLSTDALLSLRLDLWSQRGVIHSLNSFFLSLSPSCMQFHRSPSLLNPITYITPIFFTPSTTITSFLVFSLSLSLCGLQHVFPILAVMHSSPQSDLISPRHVCPPSTAPTMADKARGQKSGVVGGSMDRIREQGLWVMCQVLQH